MSVRKSDQQNSSIWFNSPRKRRRDQGRGGGQRGEGEKEEEGGRTHEMASASRMTCTGGRLKAYGHYGYGELRWM